MFSYSHKDALMWTRLGKLVTLSILMGLLSCVAPGIALAEPPTPPNAVESVPLADLPPLPDKFLFAIGANQAGGQFNTPSGIAVSSDGTSIIADSGNNRIQRLSADGQVLAIWGSLGSGEGQFNSPEDVAIAPDGTVFVADTGNARVQQFTAEGVFLKQWGTEGEADGQFWTPKGLAVAPDGTVYVTDYGSCRLQRFTAAGLFLARWGTCGQGNNQFYGPADVAVAPDGTLYVADSANSRILHLSATGAFLGKWGSHGYAQAGAKFHYPSGVTVAPDGTVFVADTYNHRIQHFEADGRFLGIWGSYGVGDGQFDHPAKLGVASNGTIYIADAGNNRIQRFAENGQFLGSWQQNTGVDGHFTFPTGIAAAPDGTMYVADTGSNRIEHIAANGLNLGQWGGNGVGNGQFSFPAGIAIAPDGTVYVADTYNHRIQYFSSTGVYQGQWGAYGDGDGQFDAPIALAVAPTGTVYVADRFNHRIQFFAKTGTYLGQWGSWGETGFRDPVGIAVGPDGTVYVGDARLSWIVHFTASGTYLGTMWLSESPESITIGPEEAIYVIAKSGFTSTYRIGRLAKPNFAFETWGSFGTGTGQFSEPKGIAIASDGTAYVVDRSSSRVLAFGPVHSTTWRGEYFANRWLAGTPRLLRNDAEVAFDWGTSAPSTALPSDDFSARWQRNVWFDAGSYRFMVVADDGVRLWVDDKLVIESWQSGHTFEGQVSMALAAGHHQIRLEYFEATGAARVRLNWEATAASDSLDSESLAAMASTSGRSVSLFRPAPQEPRPRAMPSKFIAAAAPSIIAPSSTPQTSTMPLPNGAPLGELADRLGITVGTVLDGSLFSNQTYQQILSRDFNLATIDGGVYWPNSEPGRGIFRLDWPDTQTQFAQKYQLPIRYHPLLWEALGTDSYPSWLVDSADSRDLLAGSVRNHITQLVSHFRGNAREWVVVNEVTDDELFSTRLGSEYVEMAFRAAREADPEAVLIYNDFDNQTSYWRNYPQTLEIAQRLKPLGLIDGIGLQMHIWCADCAPEKDDLIAAMRSFDLPVYITELDVTMTGATGTRDEIWARQALIYRHLMDACLESGVCRSFTVWGIGDKYSWMTSYMGSPDAQATLFDDNLQPKPAYYAIQASLTNHLP